ncbi:LuxR C-terminal-related transcriptional regulator [Acetonema longum]|nr:DNA-binding response regulator [Acetonema longum]
MTSKMQSYRILIVDDDERYLASLRRVTHGYFDVVTTKDPVQALKIIENQGPFAVVIADYRMPVMTGIDLFSRIIAIDRNIQRILLTGYADLHMTIDAINRGKITAFLTKPVPAVSLRSVVLEAIMGYRQNQTGTFLEKILTTEFAAKLYAPLSVKEREVLHLLAKGFSNAEISKELTISVGTVKTHLNNLYCKLNVNSRAKAVAKGIEFGLIKTEEK